MAEEHDRSMMENLYWWGIPTLFRCPNLSTEGQDIVLVGVPHSTGNGTTERDQHLGPRAVRNVSAVARRVHSAFEIDPWTAAKIADMSYAEFAEYLSALNIAVVDYPPEELEDELNVLTQ